MPGRLFRIHGRVQGVGFRWWTHSQARRLGVAGTVRNCPDGSVEVRALAPDPVLDQLRSLLHQGPPGAVVTSVEESSATGIPTGEFQILR